MSCPKYISETEARNYLEAYLNAVKPDDTEDMERDVMQDGINSHTIYH